MGQSGRLYRYSGLFNLGVGHLRCNGAAAYEGVQFLLLRACAFECFGFHVCGAYSLVGFLSTLGGCMEVAQLVVAPAEVAVDLGAYCGESLFGEVDRVGTHIGDVSVLVEPLGYGHCLCYREAELARCFLLQGGCGEWGRRRFG